MRGRVPPPSLANPIPTLDNVALLLLGARVVVVGSMAAHRRDRPCRGGA